MIVHRETDTFTQARGVGCEVDIIQIRENNESRKKSIQATYDFCGTSAMLIMGQVSYYDLTSSYQRIEFSSS